MISSRESFAASRRSCLSSRLMFPSLIFFMASFNACLALLMSSPVSPISLPNCLEISSTFSPISSIRASISARVLSSSSADIPFGSLYRSYTTSSRRLEISPMSPSFVFSRSSRVSWRVFSPLSCLPRISSRVFWSCFLAKRLSSSSVFGFIKTFDAFSMASNTFNSTSSRE